MLLGYRIGRVRTIFSVVKRHVKTLFPDRDPPPYLAYIEWFTPFAQPSPLHGLYKISKAVNNGVRYATIVPLSDIRRSIHLYPLFGQVAPVQWSSSNVLDMCEKFWVNSFTDRHAYGTVV